MNRKKFIFENLQEKYNYVQDKGYEIFCLCLQGSQNYNLDIYTEEYKSDIDVKVMVLPTFYDFVYGKKPVSTTLELSDKSHIDLKDIRLMFNTFEKQNINFIEILFTKYKIINPKYKQFCEELFNMREKIAKINYNQALRCVNGMSMEKHIALEHPYPSLKERIDKYGYDCKQLHHIVRLNYFIKDFVAGKKYEDCLITTSTRRKYLKYIKIPGNIPLQEARTLAERINIETKQIKDLNILSADKVNYDTIYKLHDLQYRVLKYYFKELILLE